MIPPGMHSVPDLVSLPPNLDLVSSEDLWHALAARYDALVFAGVRDMHTDREDMDCAATGSPVSHVGLLHYLTLYLETHACEGDDAEERD